MTIRRVALAGAATGLAIQRNEFRSTTRGAFLA
jgi:hypothetical protein